TITPARFADPSTFPSVLDQPAGDAPLLEKHADQAEHTEHTEPATPPRAAVGFAGLGVPRPLVRALADTRITEPFPIQAATIPDALIGRDVLGRGQTGSGKTLAFGLPILARLAGGRSAPGRPRALILVPTRELAMQVNDALLPLGRAVGLFTRTAVGGT